jgi:hypothetical protein
MYPSYAVRYNWLIDEDSPMEIDMNIHYDDAGDLVFAADVEMTGDITSTNNKIIFIITKYWSTSYFCTVSTYDQVDFDLTTTGETGSFETPLELDDSWDLNDLSAVVLIQTLSGDHKIYQAAISDIQSTLQILSPLSFNFGEVPVGETATDQLNISNYWDEEIAGTTFVIPGFDFPADFSVSPHQSQSYNITFSPEEEILYDSFIILMSDHEYFQTQLVPVIGTGISGSSSDENLVDLKKLKLENYPNPFNPQTTISFMTTSNTENTEISIYNINGKLVKTLINEILPEGQYSVVWNGTDNEGQSVSSGIYLSMIKSGNYTSTHKMIMLK